MTAAMPTPVPAPKPLARLGGRDVEIVDKGEGPLVLVLHGLHDYAPDTPFLDRLAARARVIAPTHPGFGGTPRGPEMATMYDLVHHYRALIEDMGAPACVIGFSFGGWIAAELAAAKVPMKSLVLVGALGVKFGDRETRDFAHFFNTHPSQMLEHGWSDPSRRPVGAVGTGWPLTLDEFPDEELFRIRNSNEALSLYGWSPHMYNPRLVHWLPRISVPTHLVWGQDDRIAPVGYGRRYAEAIPGAGFSVIPDAGHHPELEQPDAFVSVVSEFIGIARTGRD